MGIALSTINEEDAASLLAKADRAMYHAKMPGKGQHALFTEAMLTAGKTA